MPLLTITDAQLHYQTDGDRRHPCIVFSNSLGTDLTMWDAQAADLATDHYVIRYDTRGHGRSTSGSAPVDMDQLGLDVLSLLNHLDCEQAGFCGISMGGLTGQWLGIHAPQRFSHLVLANTAARIGSAAAWQARAQQVRTAGLAGVAAGAAERWFTAAYRAEQPDTVAKLVTGLAQQDPLGYALCCDVLALADLRDRVSDITVPTLIIAGEHDAVTTVADGNWLRQQIMGATLTTLPASHLSNLEASTQFTAALRAVL